MPELPEVETIARGLRTYVIGKTIREVKVYHGKRFPRLVIGQKIAQISRQAKWLVIHLSSSYNFVVHLKMTGQLLYKKTTPKFLGGHTMRSEQITLPNSHTRVEFRFTDGSRLFFQDMRKFGYVKLYSDKALKDYFAQKNIGPEPLAKTFTFNYFNTQLQRHGSTTIKAVLLNQTIIGGIGNIYADDICWYARVKPMRRVRTLTLSERKLLHLATQKIITEAIRLGGTSFSHYYQVDGKLGSYWKKRKVYGRTAEPCRRCAQPIKKTRCAGRGTHYCSNCQK